MCDAARPDGSLYVPYLAIELRWIIGHCFLSNIYLFQPTSIGAPGPADNDGRGEQKHGDD